MADKAKIAVFISGTGSNMAALLYASRLPTALTSGPVASTIPPRPVCAGRSRRSVDPSPLTRGSLTRRA